MFKFLGSKKNYFLGIDFGTSAIKVVELSYQKSGIHLSNYGWAELPRGNRVANSTMTQDDKNKEIENILKKLINKMNIKSDSAHISIGAFKGLSALVEIFDVDKDNIEEIIKVEANKYIPISLDEVYLSWDIVSRKNKKNVLEKIKEHKVGGESKEKKSIEVLLVAAPKEDVHKYEKIVSNIDIKVASLELDIFATVRSLIGDDLGTFLIIDMGAKITNLMLVKKGVIRVNRNINVGGDEITKAIMSNLNVSWSRAEEFKKKNNYLSGEGKMMVDPVIENISKEAKRIIEIGINGDKRNKIDNVIITGGGFDIIGIDRMFFDKLGVRTIVGNPWKKIIIENNRIKEKSLEISTNLSVATGLALKGAKKYKRN